MNELGGASRNLFVIIARPGDGVAVTMEVLFDLFDRLLPIHNQLSTCFKFALEEGDRVGNSCLSLVKSVLVLLRNALHVPND